MHLSPLKHFGHVAFVGFWPGSPYTPCSKWSIWSGWARCDSCCIVWLLRWLEAVDVVTKCFRGIHTWVDRLQSAVWAFCMSHVSFLCSTSCGIIESKHAVFWKCGMVVLYRYYCVQGRGIDKCILLLEGHVGPRKYMLVVIRYIVCIRP